MKNSEVKPSYTTLSTTDPNQGYRKILYSFQRKFVQGVFLGIEDCTRFVLLAEEKLCTLAKGVLPSGAQGTCCRVYTRKVKENLKHLAWGLDVGHKDRTRITLCCLRLFFCA